MHLRSALERFRGRGAPAASAKDVHAGSGPALEPELGSESAAVAAALTAWRRKAANIVMAVVVAANLPVIVLGIFGHGPPMGPLVKGIGIAGYLVLAAAALFRRIEYRTRLLVRGELQARTFRKTASIRPRASARTRSRLMGHMITRSSLILSHR